MGNWKIENEEIVEKLLVTSEDREYTMGSHFGCQMYNPALMADNEQVEDPMRLHAAIASTTRILINPLNIFF